MSYVICKDKDLLCKSESFLNINDEYFNAEDLLIFKNRKEAWIKFREIFGLDYRIDNNKGYIYKIENEEDCSFICSIKLLIRHAVLEPDNKCLIKLNIIGRLKAMQFIQDYHKDVTSEDNLDNYILMIEKYLSNNVTLNYELRSDKDKEGIIRFLPFDDSDVERLKP